MAVVESVKNAGHDYFAFFVCRDPVAKLVSTYKLVSQRPPSSSGSEKERNRQQYHHHSQISLLPSMTPRYNLARSRGRGGQEGGRARAIGFPAGVPYSVPKKCFKKCQKSVKERVLLAPSIGARRIASEVNCDSIRTYGAVLTRTQSVL